MFDFSFIVPSRGRPALLKQCIESIYKKAINPVFVETILILDYDDENAEILEFLEKFEFNHCVKTIIRSRSRKIIRDYNNLGAQLSKGKYIWILNDDARVETDGYDNVLIYNINRFLRDKPDRLLYVMVNDDIHIHLKKEIFNYGTCFPIISREVYDAIGCLMPPEIDAWGADTEIYRIFQYIKKDRKLNLMDKIALKCTTIHNESLPEMDPTQSGMHQASVCRSLTDAQLNHYIELLNRKIAE